MIQNEEKINIANSILKVLDTEKQEEGYFKVYSAMEYLSEKGDQKIFKPNFLFEKIQEMNFRSIKELKLITKGVMWPTLQFYGNKIEIINEIKDYICDLDGFNDMEKFYVKDSLFLKRGNKEVEIGNKNNQPAKLIETLWPIGIHKKLDTIFENVWPNEKDSLSTIVKKERIEIIKKELQRDHKLRKLGLSLKYDKTRDTFFFEIKKSGE